MSEEKKDMDNNIVNIDQGRLKRLKERGHMMTILEEFEKLKLKFFYEKDMSKSEALNFVTLCKFLMENAPSEPYRMSCRYLFEKYMEKFGL